MNLSLRGTKQSVEYGTPTIEPYPTDCFVPRNDSTLILNVHLKNSQIKLRLILKIPKS